MHATKRRGNRYRVQTSAWRPDILNEDFLDFPQFLQLKAGSASFTRLVLAISPSFLDDKKQIQQLTLHVNKSHVLTGISYARPQ
jgi:hypothetical protein